MKILGIDPALNKSGWGVIEIANDNTIKYLASDIIEVSRAPDIFAKLKIISENINKILTDFKPDEIALEETFVNKNPSTSLKLGMARGAIINNCLNYTDHIYEYAPRHIKKSIVGVGSAEKAQISMMVKILLPQANFKYDDESDALAAAITHFHSRNFKNL